MEEIRQFYRDLYSEMKAILKPHGFRKKKDRFRCLLANGIFWEIELQRQDFKMALMFHFTVNIHVGLAPSVAEKDLWTIPDGPNQLWGHLGESLEDGWHHQKWYDLSALVNPRVRAQVVDGQFPLTFKEPGQDWKTVWIPYPSAGQIREEICRLTREKVLPFFLSVQTLEQYLALLKDHQDLNLSWGEAAARLYAEVFGAGFLPVLADWIALQETFLQREKRQDISSLSPSGRQLHSDMLQRTAEQLRVYRELQDHLTKRACSPPADPPLSP